MALRLLGEVDSVSAEMTLRLDLTREIIAVALSTLRMQHHGQVNLLRKLCGTRDRYYYIGDTPVDMAPKHLLGVGV